MPIPIQNRGQQGCWPRDYRDVFTACFEWVWAGKPVKYRMTLFENGPKELGHRQNHLPPGAALGYRGKCRFVVIQGIDLGDLGRELAAINHLD